ncbi:hypothetical protein U14_05783 [Candidatus Moduliflexus flocculans]|uniref:TRAM domain-containing protein n=1 Tax=Candidatus Moduliflexus flocculans TaxID=1499966 RepID=A0A081BSW6_9BACT|nr:hypothetical protein U14_05783 [Candidatus Moduliflexus flocculans]
MFGFHTSEAAVFGTVWGLTVGILIVFLELLLLKLPSLAILGGLIGGMLGLILANLLTGSSLFLHLPIAPFTSYIRTSVTLLFFLVGLMVGVQRIQSLTLQSLRRLFIEPTSGKNYKILDTSVIIDGRIADISETGFLEGVLVIPQFILQELQHIADSPDPIKRNRGRRGLEILHKIQKRVDIQVEIHERDFPKIKEIDAKLVELGKHLQAKLITNDFNLNKVAELQGVPVLNVNQLANALKPVVLPGEVMEVLVLKEGKEYGQGIAYLDDGTMIVIDNAKKLIGKTVGVAVTSVLQTTAGRMIFGQLAVKDAAR